MTCTERVLNGRGVKLRLRMSGAVLRSPIRLYDVHRESFTLLPLYLPLHRTLYVCVYVCMYQ